MAAQHLTVLASSVFPQHPEDSIEHARRRTKWPASIREDQAAIEQARQELGPDADPHAVLARAQQIKQALNRQTAREHYEEQARMAALAVPRG